MSKLIAAVVSLSLLAAAVPAVLQERVKPKGPADFHDLVDAAKTDWDAGHYATCIDRLQSAIGLATERRSGALLEAFPAAPAGWEIVPDRSGGGARNNPFAQAMAASIGNITTREYRQTGGRGTVKATLTADSPLVSMISMTMANPAMLEDGSELIKYGSHNGVLKVQQNGALELKILISNAHLCEVTTTGLDEDGLFAMFDQKAVDKLAAALGG